jgi:hypothetical protein
MAGTKREKKRPARNAIEQPTPSEAKGEVLYTCMVCLGEYELADMQPKICRCKIPNDCVSCHAEWIKHQVSSSLFSHRSCVTCDHTTSRRNWNSRDLPEICVYLLFILGLMWILFAIYGLDEHERRALAQVSNMYAALLPLGPARPLSWVVGCATCKYDPTAGWNCKNDPTGASCAASGFVASVPTPVAVSSPAIRLELSSFDRGISNPDVAPGVVRSVPISSRSGLQHGRRCRVGGEELGETVGRESFPCFPLTNEEK